MSRDTSWGAVNLCTLSTTVVAAKTENIVFIANNLLANRFKPPYLSADKFLELNGSDEYCSVLHHADFNATTQFSQETVFILDSLPGGVEIFRKYDGVNGIRVAVLITGEVRVKVDNSGTTDGTIDSAASTISLDTLYKLKIVYDGSGPTVTAYLNESPLAMNVTAGTVPAAIGANTHTLYFGSNNGTSSFLPGKIARSAFAITAFDNGADLDPLLSGGFWEFGNNNLDDSSGNGHTLTGVNIDAGNFVNELTNQWIDFEFAAAQQPTYIVIPAGHNIGNNGGSPMISLKRGDRYSVVQEVVVDQQSVVAGQPIVIRIATPTADTHWSIEIDDADNLAGTIEIPYVFMGVRSPMEKSFQIGFNEADILLGQMTADGSGSYTAYPRTDEIYQAGPLRFRANSNDKAILESVFAEARRGRPVIFCPSEDDEDTDTKLVYLPEAMNPRVQKISTKRHLMDVPIIEAGGGL